MSYCFHFKESPKLPTNVLTNTLKTYNLLDILNVNYISYNFIVFYDFIICANNAIKTIDFYKQQVIKTIIDNYSKVKTSIILQKDKL